MIPEDHPLSSSTLVRHITSGEVFVACNCVTQPANRTLRYIAKNREKFELASYNPAPQGRTISSAGTHTAPPPPPTEN